MPTLDTLARHASESRLSMASTARKRRRRRHDIILPLDGVGGASFREEGVEPRRD